jgi:acetyl esterase/lipase
LSHRLAPEHPFSAQIEDSVAAYKWLIYDQKIAANRTVFAGDSAGGGLVLLTLLALQDEDKGMLYIAFYAIHW